MREGESFWSAIHKAVVEGRDLHDFETELWEKYGRTLAVMVLDSTGFSRATQTFGIVRYLVLLVHLRLIGRHVFQETNALRHREEADNLYADFATVDQAVDAAFRIHHLIKTAGLRLDHGQPFGACIGIGYGRMLLCSHEGMFGDEMNKASKLGEDTAKGGETLLTEAAYHKLSNPGRYLVEKRETTVSGLTMPYYALQTQ